MHIPRMKFLSPTENHSPTRFPDFPETVRPYSRAAWGKPNNSGKETLLLISRVAEIPKVDRILGKYRERANDDCD